MRKFLFALVAVLFLCSVVFAGQGMAPGPGVKGYSGGGADTTPPTLNSATIPSAGTSITLALSETVAIGAGGNGGWVIMPGGTPTNATRNPTSDEAISGTWDGTAGSRYTIVNDYPDSAPTNYLSHGTTTAGYLTFGFSAFSIPAGSTNISVDVLYYDYRASGTDNMGSRIKVGGTYYDSATHQPTAAYTLQTNSWATNPKTTTAWTVDDVNGAGANALQAFGFHSTDANPAIRVTSIILRVNYTPPDSITYSSGSGSSSLVYTLPWTAACQTTYTGYYTQPGNGVEDTAGNDLASITSPFSVTNSMPPPAPTGHSTVSGNALCTMHPGTANCATSYKYYYKAGADPTTSSYDATGTATDAANITSLTNGTAYHFGYVAASANGDSVLSTIDTCTPASGSSYSDAFGTNTIGTDWTVVSGSAAISSGVLYITDATWAISRVVYQHALSGASGYMKGTLSGLASTSHYPFFLFRYTNSSSNYYCLYFFTGTNELKLVSITSGGSESTDATQGSATVSEGVTYGITWTGTAPITIRVWVSPADNAPTSNGTLWNGVAPDYTLSATPANRNDTGTYVGFGAEQGVSQDSGYDNFFAGDLQ